MAGNYMKNIYFTPIRFSLAIFATSLALLLQPALAQGIGDDIPDIALEEIQKIQADAQTHYALAFSNLDDAEYIKTAEILQALIRDYGTHPMAHNAFFYLADIYSARLQGEQYFRSAIRVLQSFLRENPDSDKTLDAQLRIALIDYRYLNDFNAAISTLEDYFNSYSTKKYLESEKLQAQILLAKCYQKSGGFASEQKIWDSLMLTNPDADRTGRSRFLGELDNWKRLPGNGVTLYFHAGIPEATYRRVLKSAEGELAKLVAKFGHILPGPVEVYLYTKTDDLVAYTTSDQPQAIDGDKEIHLQPESIGDIPRLMAMVYSIALNARPKVDRHPLMRYGFDNAYSSGEADESLDYLAAKQLLLFDEAPGGTLFLGTSNFFGTTEYSVLVGSFCRYLLAKEHVDAFMKLYRGLYPNHETPMVEGAVQRFYNKTLDDLVEAWYESLTPVIAQVKSEVGSMTYDLKPVTIDLSTPEAALETWFQALRMGDYDALLQSSTPELNQILEEAKKAYEDKGIFKEIVIEQFVYPYYPTTYDIVRSGSLGNEAFIFRIGVVKDGKVISERDVPLRKINGKWYIDINP